MHQAFDETVKAADARGLRVTGSELVGLVPLKAMLDAGDYFLKKQQRSLGISDEEKIKMTNQLFTKLIKKLAQKYELLQEIKSKLVFSWEDL